MLDQSRLLRLLFTCSICGVTYILLSQVTSNFVATLAGVSLAAFAALCKETVDRFIDGEGWNKYNFIAEGIGIAACLIVILISIFILHE